MRTTDDQNRRGNCLGNHRSPGRRQAAPPQAGGGSERFVDLLICRALPTVSAGQALPNDSHRFRSGKAKAPICTMLKRSLVEVFVPSAARPTVSGGIHPCDMRNGTSTCQGDPSTCYYRCSPRQANVCYDLFVL